MHYHILNKSHATEQGSVPRTYAVQGRASVAHGEPRTSSIDGPSVDSVPATAQTPVSLVDEAKLITLITKLYSTGSLPSSSLQGRTLTKYIPGARSKLAGPTKLPAQPSAPPQPAKAPIAPSTRPFRYPLFQCAPAASEIPTLEAMTRAHVTASCTRATASDATVDNEVCLEAEAGIAFEAGASGDVCGVEAADVVSGDEDLDVVSDSDASSDAGGVDDVLFLADRARARRPEYMNAPDASELLPPHIRTGDKLSRPRLVQRPSFGERVKAKLAAYYEKKRADEAAAAADAVEAASSRAGVDEQHYGAVRSPSPLELPGPYLLEQRKNLSTVNSPYLRAPSPSELRAPKDYTFGERGFGSRLIIEDDDEMPPSPEMLPAPKDYTGIPTDVAYGVLTSNDEDSGWTTDYECSGSCCDDNVSTANTSPEYAPESICSCSACASEASEECASEHWIEYASDSDGDNLVHPSPRYAYTSRTSPVVGELGQARMLSTMPWPQSAQWWQPAGQFFV
ncbi:hypothetical protein HDZ31DRAFT_73047 [Schizophyllum fasciatum]